MMNFEESIQCPVAAFLSLAGAELRYWVNDNEMLEWLHYQGPADGFYWVQCQHERYTVSFGYRAGRAFGASKLTAHISHSSGRVFANLDFPTTSTPEDLADGVVEAICNAHES